MSDRARGLWRIDCVVQSKRISLLIHPTDVFVPNLMSWFSAAAMRVLPGEVFCDVGLGSGLHAILAAKLGAKRVYGTDVNLAALRIAKENARRNGVASACRFFRGSLVEPLLRRGLRVDAVIYNAPQFPGSRVDRRWPALLKTAVDAGPRGGELNARFLRDAWRILRPGGRIYNPVVGWAGPSLSLRAIRDGGYSAHEEARTHVPAWGRGNHTRDWLLDHPGAHEFWFRHRPDGNSLARILQLRREGAPVDLPRDPLPIRVIFHTEK